MEENRFLEEHPERFSLCMVYRSQLPDYIEGYLDELAAEALRAHLAVCYMCSREFREMQRTIELIETLPFADAGKDFSNGVMASIMSRSGSFKAGTGVASAKKRGRKPRGANGQDGAGEHLEGDTASSDWRAALRRHARALYDALRKPPPGT